MGTMSWTRRSKPPAITWCNSRTTSVVGFKGTPYTQLGYDVYGNDRSLNEQVIARGLT